MQTKDAANSGGGAGTNGPPTKPTKRWQWLSTRQVGDLAGRHQETVLLALRRGLLRGTQAGVNSTWRVREDWAADWLDRGAPSKTAA